MENYKKLILFVFLIISTYCKLEASNIKAINRVLSHEGTQLVNNKTEFSKYGITSSYLKKFNKIKKTNYKVTEIDYLDAQYIIEYILLSNKIDKINNQKIKEQALDIIFNTGPKGIYIIQNSINEFSNSHKLGIKIKVDGIMGTETVNSINSIENKVALNQLIYKNRIIFYQKLNNWNTYKKGWLKRIESYK